MRPMPASILKQVSRKTGNIHSTGVSTQNPGLCMRKGWFLAERFSRIRKNRKAG
jgi:hypothetical protein